MGIAGRIWNGVVAVVMAVSAVQVWRGSYMPPTYLIGFMYAALAAAFLSRALKEK